MITIREFDYTDKDYTDFVALNRAIMPDHAATVEQWKHWDKPDDSRIRRGRFLLEADGVMIGFAQFGQSTNRYHPHKFDVSIGVLPTMQGKGHGKQLYEHLLAELAPYNPIALKAGTRADYPRALRFAAERGFVEESREWELRLDPHTVDLSAWQHRLDQLRTVNITIKSMRALANDPNHNRKMFKLLTELSADVPNPEPQTPVNFDKWRTRLLNNPSLDETLQLFALDGDSYIGYSGLWLDLARDDHLWTGLTGVQRAYRRRGIATALKIAAIQVALVRNTTCIHTSNAVNNRGMLTINEQLGFVKQPAWIDFVKEMEAINDV